MRLVHLLAVLSLIAVGGCDRDKDIKIDPTTPIFKMNEADVVSWRDDGQKITLTLNGKSANVLGMLSARYVGKRLPIYYKDTMLDAPVIHKPVTGITLIFAGDAKSHAMLLEKLPTNRKSAQ